MIALIAGVLAAALVAAELLALVFLAASRDDRDRLLSAKEIHLVVAHPDDESMFFLPVCVAAASAVSARKRLTCLSDGGFDGLGAVRRRELDRVASSLGFDALTIGDFQDGPRQKWPLEGVATFVTQQGVQNASFVISFDRYGVSGHANHIACRNGLMHLKATAAPALPLWSLRSDTNILLKYSGPLGAALALIRRRPHQIVLINHDPILAYRTMALHHSQFVWFRRLFILFARCVYVNILEQEQVA